MKLLSLSTPLNRRTKPVITASMNLPVTIAYLEIDDAKNIKEIRLMADITGERRK